MSSQESENSSSCEQSENESELEVMPKETLKQSQAIKKTAKKTKWEIIWERDGAECKKLYRTLKDVEKDHPCLTRARCSWIAKNSKNCKPTHKDAKYILSIKKITC